MFTVISLLIIFFLSFKFLSNHIKMIRTGDPNENDLTYWMFSYDFKSPNKEWIPEDKQLRQKKRTRNALVFALYLNVDIAMLLMKAGFHGYLSYDDRGLI